MELIRQEWQIIEQIAKGNTHPASIAKKLGTSTSTVIQKLKVLEAYGVVKKHREKHKENKDGIKTKHRVSYKLSESFAIIAVAMPNNAGLTIIKPLKREDKVLAVFLQPSNIKELTLKALCQYSWLLNADCIGFVSATHDTVELLVITQSLEQAEDFRKKQEALTITTGSATNTVVKTLKLHVHTKQEVMQGLEKQDLHFKGLIDVTKPVIDDGFLQEAKNLKKKS